MAIDLSKIPLSPAIRHNDTLYLSGQLAFGEPGVLINGGIEAQTKQVMLNIETVLKKHSISLKDVIKTTIWLTNKSDFAGFNAAYGQFFDPGHYPTRSTVISGLLIDGALIEIEVIARLPE